jgi:hypothetical protein
METGCDDGECADSAEMRSVPGSACLSQEYPFRAFMFASPGSLGFPFPPRSSATMNSIPIKTSKLPKPPLRSWFKVRCSRFDVRCSMFRDLRLWTLDFPGGTTGTPRYGWRYGRHIKSTQCLQALVRWYGSSPPRPTPPGSKFKVRGSRFKVQSSMFDVRRL